MGTRVWIAATLLLSVARARAEEPHYRIELAPSGTIVSIGVPVTRGTSVLFHGTDGNLMSLRKADVKRITRMASQEPVSPAPTSVIAIGNLAMQGGSASSAAPARPASAGAAAAGPRWNGYDSWTVVPGAADAPPPASAVQVSPGAPPTLPPAPVLPP